MKKLKKISPYIINGILVVTIFLIALLINKLYPFGNNMIPKHDAIYQYQPMLYDFITKIKEGLLTSFTFNNGLGQPLMFNFLYYLSSPINLLVLPLKSASSMFLAVILIKLFITAITTTFYVKKRTNNNYLATIIAISYSFCSWFLAYYYSIMWLDAFMIFPLFQYGLEELMNKNKNKIYIFSLAYIMISNFYIAFIVCLYTLIYYIYNIIFKKEKYIYKIKNFQLIAISTIITLLLSTFHIYATYDSFMRMGVYINIVTRDATTIPILNYLQSFLSGSKNVNLLSIGEIFPNIALNTIFTISFLYYFVNNKISKKDKIKTLISFIFITILIYSKTLNYIANCFHVPIGYNFRYSFIISFYFILIFIKNYQTFTNKIDKKIYLINILLIALILVEYFFNDLSLKFFIHNLVFISLLTLFFIFYKNNKIYKILLTATIVLEVAINASINITNSFSMPLNFNYNDKVTTYRENINYDFPLKLNLNLYENRNTISNSFSSMQYNSIFDDLNKLGCVNDFKATINDCKLPTIFNMLFNIKTDNNYYLEKIYSANKDILTISLNEATVVENQKLLLETLTKVENIIEEVELKQKDKYTTIYTIKKAGTYYIPLHFKQLHKVKINNTIYTYDDEVKVKKDEKLVLINRQSNLEVKLNKNDTIELIFLNKKDKEVPENLTLYKINDENFNLAYNYLKDNQIKYTNYKDDKIEGTITVDKNEVIFTTIPYDDNWILTIDGKEIKPTLVLSSLLGFECPEGTHTIKLEYKNKFLIPSIISITTFVILVINIIIKKHKKKK